MAIESAKNYTQKKQLNIWIIFIFVSLMSMVCGKVGSYSTALQAKALTQDELEAIWLQKRLICVLACSCQLLRVLWPVLM
jgi:hypothetical protein